MAKNWICSACQNVTLKWAGQCNKCLSWNTIAEEIPLGSFKKKSQPLPLMGTVATQTSRLSSSFAEMDRLLGGGVVKGSLVLVGGDPGIGKSTLLLQLAFGLSKNEGIKVLYVSAEESFEQTFLRSERMNIKSPQVFVYSEASMGAIERQIELIAPDVIIIDSIQMIFKEEIPSSPGSVVQVKECATDLMRIAKGKNIAIFLIGHVTKGGELAGPRILEHLVDTVLYFEGENERNLRFLRVVKNRFGSSDEIAVFQMQSKGLVEIEHPSGFFLEERTKEISGSAIVAPIEGSRPFLVEVQALVSKTGFATPSRRATGVDPNRLALILAVLEKRLGFELYSYDVFVSVVGGMKIKEPAIDVGLILAVISSFHNKPFPLDLLAMGEVGLGGEIRAITRIEGRLKEAIQMGFKKVLLPKRCVAGLPTELTSKISVVPIEVVEDAIEFLGV